MLESLKFAALAAAFVMGTSAQAGPITGSQNFSVHGATTTSPIPMSVATATSFFMTGVGTQSSQTGDFVGYANSPLDDTTLNVASLGTFTFGSTDFGTFLASVGIELFTVEPNTREFRFLGTFSPGTDPIWTGFDATGGGVLLNLNQSGGMGKAIAVSWSLNVNPGLVIGPTAIPEPGSLTLAGLGLFGMIGMTWLNATKVKKAAKKSCRG